MVASRLLPAGTACPATPLTGSIEDNDHSFWLYMRCGLVRIARSELDAWVSDSKRSIQTTVFDSSDGVMESWPSWPPTDDR